MAEPAFAAGAAFEFLYHLELHPSHRHEHHLRDPVTRLDDHVMLAPVPRRDHQLALVIGIDQSHQIAQHDTVFVSQTGTR